MARAALAALAALVVVGAGLAGLVVRQNTYDLREETVTVRYGGRTLHAVLALPERGEGPFPLVVFVHGDGPVDATHDGFYRPMWESFARAGYASLSWNKPGVGGAPGDWLDQTMEDRAREAAAAIAWAVLLVLAGHDVNVDTTDTEAAYRRLLPAPPLRVAHYPTATHGLIRHDVERSRVRLTLTALCAPRTLFAEGFLSDQRRFLSSLATDEAGR
ncbi:alpha/beta hydrolase family protein [Streptomyces sp. NPDC057193]|uniref:alpha/beta hydrolase family protein n=1 Tax=Streptomyces sp. NPDC057193 TaxID=3346043 RepID=UPI003645D00B